MGKDLHPFSPNAPAERRRAPPHNYEAEQAFLGACLANNGVWGEAIDFLKPDHFADALHGRIFEAISRLCTRGEIANPVTLKNLFDQDGALSQIGGAKYLVDLAQSVVTIVSAGDYARAIRDLFVQRQIIGLADDLEEAGYISDPNRTPLDVVGEFEGRLFEIGQSATSGTSNKARQADEYLYAAIQHAEHAHKVKGIASGVLTGLRDVDSIIGALENSSMNLLAGRPSQGKTALALCIADHVAATQGPVLFNSLEMTAEQLGMRHLSIKSGVSGDLARKGQLSDMDFNLLNDARQAMHGLPLAIDDTPSINVPQMLSRARQHRRRHGLVLWVVDHAHLTKPVRELDNKAAQYTEISRQYKEAAKILGVPLLLLCQLSRENEKRPNKRPQLSDLRESGAFEQDADLVAFVYREEYYHAKSKPEDGEKLQTWQDQQERIAGKAEILIDKNRIGPVGGTKTKFDKATTRFSDLGGQGDGTN